MTRRLFPEAPDLDCPVCSKRHVPGEDCNDWPYMPLHPTYPFAPPTPPAREKKPNRRGKRVERTTAKRPGENRAHLSPEDDR